MLFPFTERWCTELGIFKIIKQNLRLSLFILFVIVLTIYLFIDTSGNPSVSTGGVVSELPLEAVDEIGEDVIEEEEGFDESVSDESLPESEEVIMDNMNDGGESIEIDSDDIFTENRPSFIKEDLNEIDSHQKITENNQLSLYLNEENLSLIVRDKYSGAVMYSTVEEPQGSNEQWTNFMKSGIVIQYLVGTNIVYYQADMYSHQPEKTISYTEDGFIANLLYPDLGISLDLAVSLEENDVVVHIPEDSIVEADDEFKIGNIYVYPFMGYTKLDEEPGYMLIPDGSGASISLENNNGQYKQPYSEMVYGSNIGIDDPYVLSLMYGMVTTNEPNNIIAPIFGMNHDEKEFGYIGVIEEGDWSAHIQAYPNGAILPYNWITSRFTYRQFYNQSTSQTSGTMVIRQKERNPFDVTVRYRFVTGENANYMGMAKSYREYLLTNELVERKNHNDIPVMRLDFLGADIEEGIVGKNVVPVTTISQADEMLEELSEDGVKNLMVVYKGLQTNGVYGGLAQNSFNVDSRLGRIGDLEELINKYSSTTPIYLYDDAIRFNPDMQNEVFVDLATKYNKRLFRETVHGKVFTGFNFLQPDESVNRLQKRLDSLMLESPNIVLNGISNNVFSYLEDSEENSRIITGSIFLDAIKEISEQTTLSLETPFQPYWKYTNAFIDMPIDSSGYVFESESIPFLSMTLNGVIPFYTTYTNFQSNQTDFFLRLIESGARPTYLLTYENSAALYNTNSSYIYSSEFNNYREEIVFMHDEFNRIHEAIDGSSMSGYEKEDDQVVVKYENGVTILINYSVEAQEIEGFDIEPKSYKVVE